ncbi:type I restriction endonuclease [Novosphingobium panipatense]
MVERASIQILQDLGWNYLHGAVIAPDGIAAERQAFSDVLLLPRLEKAVADLNPTLPEAARLKPSAGFSRARQVRWLRKTAASIVC